MKTTTTIAIFAALLLGCTQPSPAENQPACEPETAACTPEVKPEPEPTVDVSKLGKLEDADAPEQARAIAKIEEVSLLKFKNTVPVYIYTAKDLEAELATWGGDFRPSNVMGFYRFATKAMYLVPEVAGNRRAFGLRIHEGVHALQDQHWGLPKLHESMNTTDGYWAVLGLIEGHAVQVMIDALIEDQPHVAYIAKAKAPEGSNDPQTYRAVYTYAQGTRFIQHLKSTDGYKLVNRSFLNPPVSSEQVLHPEKYTTDIDLPDVVTLDIASLKTALPTGFKLDDVDTHGEFETRMTLVTHRETVKDAESIAAGWGGDQIVVARKDEATVTVWVSSWDTKEDAKAFADGIVLHSDTRFIDISADDSKVIYVIKSSGEVSDDERSSLIAALGKTKVTFVK
ncbi:MAG: hypothetical protein V3V10_08345 [Planctomycetota bacterium]